jgi:hypothetical protein
MDPASAAGIGLGAVSLAIQVFDGALKGNDTLTMFGVPLFIFFQDSRYSRMPPTHTKSVKASKHGFESSTTA